MFPNSSQAEHYAVTATPSSRRRPPGGEVTTDEDIIGREEKGLLDEHVQAATAQTKFTWVVCLIIIVVVASLLAPTFSMLELSMHLFQITKINLVDK